MLAFKVNGAGIPGLAVLAICKDTATSVSAAGTTQGTATELVNADNEVTTVGSGAGVNTGCIFKFISSTRIFGVLSA